MAQRHARAGAHGGRMLHMAAAAASMVCQLGSRSRGSLPEAMATRGGRMPTPASQALRERLCGRELAGEGGSARGPPDRLVGSADAATDSARPVRVRSDCMQPARC